MKRPRIALCLLMALFATSLYAVGFAADRENAAYGKGPSQRAVDEVDFCEFAYEGYCEYAYDRPATANLYDSCTADEEDSLDSYDFYNGYSAADDGSLESDASSDDYASEDDDYDYDHYAVDEDDSYDSSSEYAADDDDSYDVYGDYAAGHDGDDDYYAADQDDSYDSSSEYAADDDDSYDVYGDYAAGDEDACNADDCYSVAADDEALIICEDLNCQVEAIDAEFEALCNDEYSDESGDDSATDAALGYDDYEGESAYEDDYSQELVENAEPQASDAGAWCGRFCLNRESMPADSLPAGTVRKLIERVNESLARLLNNASQDMDMSADWQAEFDAEELAACEDESPVVFPTFAAAGLLDGRNWSAANSALAAGANQVISVDPLSMPARSLRLPAGELKPVSLRALVRPLARLMLDLRSGWQQAWSEVSELASDTDEVPAVSSRPAANDPGNSGRDTRTSLRRNPRRVEI